MDGMLDRITARQLSEWIAFERYNGPIGDEWTADIQASIHEQLQLGNHIAGAQAKKNPIPKPKHMPRPWEMHGYEEPEVELTEIEKIEKQQDEIAAFNKAMDAEKGGE